MSTSHTPAPTEMSASEPSGPSGSVLDQLKVRIRAIERRSTTPRHGLKAVDRGAAWTLGDAALDKECDQHPRKPRVGHASLESLELEIGAVHEIKPAGSGADWVPAWTAARSFALALAGRRLMMCRDRERGQDGGQDGPAPCGDILWCTTAAMTTELGALHGPGLAARGLDPARLIVVEAARQPDALWALEQGLRSGCLALAVAQIDEIELTPARRLALAAASSGTPCLVVTHPRGAATAATATRWRIAPAPSARHPFDPDAPGAARFTVALERCRSRPAAATTEPILLEWCDAAYRLRVVAAVADRTDAADRSAQPRLSASA